MENYEQKLSLLSEMISFSIVDGRLHQKEYDFLCCVAKELKIEKSIFDELFHSELKPVTLKTEFQRISQFYRLALLMRVDGILHPNEDVAIKQMAINMGLNPFLTKRILTMIFESKTNTIDPKILLQVFKEQYN
jgi:hypothetical protein